LSTSYAKALEAAHAAASGQHYPKGALYVVATPIGNMADISLRALHVLQLADTIACEDTRHTQALLRGYGIEKSGQQLLALHQHNEREGAAEVVGRLQRGERAAYASDAGTPGISDPGARLVATVRAAGFPAIPLPGASSVTAALSVAGVTGEALREGAFVFDGFAPSKPRERDAYVASLASETRAVVLLEAPHRIAELALALGVLGERPVTLARELSKQFEEVSTLCASELAAWLEGDRHRARGEFVVVLHPTPARQDTGNAEALRILALLQAELPLKTAVRLTMEITGAARNTLYAAALRHRTEADTAAGGELDGPTP
jgi:16S rRNA (cytidine1402-2'-O)-methyltransferase